MMRALVSILLGLLGAAASAQPTLTVYTYASFTAEWGPGPAIEKAFEETCGCNLELVALDDGVALLARVRLEGRRTKADVVLGLDTNLTAEAAATGLFAPHGLELADLALPAPWDDPVFVPYDYGYFAFVHDRTRLDTPPRSLEALVSGSHDEKIIIQDPRTSTPGLGLLLWMRKVYGDDAASAWRRLSPRVLTVTKGWSEAYGLFLEGEAPLVLSYTTSPAYHRIAESDDRFAAATFEEGHYLQIEVAARLAQSEQAALADRFLRFVVSDAFQRHVPTGNWMYPVIALEDGLPEGFDPPVHAKRTLSLSPESVRAGRKRWVDEWLEAMSR